MNDHWMNTFHCANNSMGWYKVYIFIMDSDVECDIWLQTMNILMQTTFCFYAKSNNSPDRSIWVIQWVIFPVILQQNFSRISSNNNFLIWHWNIYSQLQTKSIKKRFIYTGGGRHWVQRSGERILFWYVPQFIKPGCVFIVIAH